MCDDIQLHHDEMRIHKAKNACILGTAWFMNHTAEKKYPDALIDGKEATLDEAIEAAAELSARGRHAAGLRHEQHDVRGPARSGRAGRAARRPARQSHLVLTRSHRDRRPVGWQGNLHARRSEEESRLHRVLGRQPGRVPSAPFHQVHHHAEEQVPARGRKDRTMVLVDIRETKSAKAADIFLQIRPGKDFELITILRAMVKGQQVDAASDRRNRPDAREARRPH